LPLRVNAFGILFLWTGLVALRSRVASLRLRNELGPPLPDSKPDVTGAARVAGGAS